MTGIVRGSCCRCFWSTHEDRSCCMSVSSVSIEGVENSSLLVVHERAVRRAEQVHVSRSSARRRSLDTGSQSVEVMTAVRTSTLNIMHDFIAYSSTSIAPSNATPTPNRRKATLAGCTFPLSSLFGLIRQQSTTLFFSIIGWCSQSLLVCSIVLQHQQSIPTQAPCRMSLLLITIVVLAGS